ncbi:hypothetical protein Vadar_018288 [Vaccinium darrowii]|uniref:Uncharacterized protein n=1 Tax=Vaccinium darrowii TaxID=229202 RepID=A0ACB7XB96_9ERIC|nr:hypothetical protein Vadar_018288 [Vaccinium darrowii]
MKDSMIVTTALVMITTKDKKREVKKKFRSVEKDKRPTLKELQAKKYPFSDSNVPGMLEDLLEKKVIQLPECKGPEKIGRVNDPKYCQYHRIISHPTEKRFVLKELRVDLASQNKILINLDEVAESNSTTIVNPLASITLRDFFPTGYFKDDIVEAVYMVSTSEEIAEDEEQNYTKKPSSTKPPLKGFVKSTQGSIQHGFLPEKRIDGFDPKAYKLLPNSGYDFNNPAPLGELSLKSLVKKFMASVKAQEELRRQGNKVSFPKTGLGFTPLLKVHSRLTTYHRTYWAT